MSKEALEHAILVLQKYSDEKKEIGTEHNNAEYIEYAKHCEVAIKALKVNIKSLKATEKVKKTTKKVAKKAASKAVPVRPNPDFMKALKPSEDLARITGSAPLARTEAVKKVWQYIKKHNLQDAKNRRMINADSKLKGIFKGQTQVSMFEMATAITKHMK